MMNKKIVTLIIAVLIVLTIFMFFKNNKNAKENKVDVSINTERDRKLEIDEYNIEPIESIYYVNPDYNPRFPDNGPDLNE